MPDTIARPVGDPPEAARAYRWRGRWDAMRNRIHQAARHRRPNGPPQAAGHPPARHRIAWPALDAAIQRDALDTLRSAVAACADELDAGSRRDDIVLVAHELATNVVRHGGGAGRLRLWRSGHRILCRVSDSGPGLADAELAGTAPPSPRMPGGRGLWIARRLAELRIETGPTGTVVIATIVV